MHLSYLTLISLIVSTYVSSRVSYQSQFLGSSCLTSLHVPCPALLSCTFELEKGN